MTEKNDRVHEVIMPAGSAVTVHCDGLQRTQDLLGIPGKNGDTPISAEVFCDNKPQVTIRCEDGLQPVGTPKKGGAKFSCE